MKIVDIQLEINNGIIFVVRKPKYVRLRARYIGSGMMQTWDPQDNITYRNNEK